MLNRTITPNIYSPVDFEYKLPPCTKQLLKNGIPLYYVNDCIEEVLQIEWVFPAGLWHENKSGIAQAAASLLKSGTAQFTSFQINETFEQYGASVKIGAGNDWASITLSCMTRHLEKLLPLISSLLTDTIFPEEEIAIYKQNAKQRLSVQLKKSDFVANRLIDEYLFGRQHPYGKYMDMADFDAITQEDLQLFLKSHYCYNNCIIFMAGKFNDATVEMVNDSFGQHEWNTSPHQQYSYQMITAKEKKYRVINDAGGVQGSIRLIRPFPEKKHPDFTPMIVLNTVFGGYFGSRLMSNIREDKGYTYGIHSYLQNNVHEGSFIITTEAGKEVCEAAIAEIYHEMKTLQQELIPADELQLVKNYLLGNILGDLDGAFQIIQRWKNLILNDFNEERFYNNIEIYKTISAEELKQLAIKYFNQAEFHELVVH